MELIKKSFSTRIKNLVDKIIDDNLFLLSSSVSYYSALGLAPFLLILLGVASLLGADIQGQITDRASSTFSPEVGDMVALIFKNVNQGVNIGSISGIIGTIVLLWTASLVFLQFRYAFDVIYGHYSTETRRPTLEIISERVFAMVVVVFAAILTMISFSLATIAEYLFGGTTEALLTRAIVFVINFAIYIVMFTGIHLFTPTRRPRTKVAFKIAVLSSIFFVIGNIFLGAYLKSVASGSIYGAAGTLLVFLVWSYYTSFTIFMSIEFFIYLKKIGRIKG